MHFRHNGEYILCLKFINYLSIGSLLGVQGVQKNLSKIQTIFSIKYNFSKDCFRSNEDYELKVCNFYRNQFFINFSSEN